MFELFKNFLGHNTNKIPKPNLKSTLFHGENEQICHQYMSMKDRTISFFELSKHFAIREPPFKRKELQKPTTLFSNSSMFSLSVIAIPLILGAISEITTLKLRLIYFFISLSLKSNSMNSTPLMGFIGMISKANTSPESPTNSLAT